MISVEPLCGMRDGMATATFSIVGWLRPHSIDRGERYYVMECNACGEVGALSTFLLPADRFLFRCERCGRVIMLAQPQQRVASLPEREEIDC